MKRFLSALLCAVLMLGLLPAVSPSARMITFAGVSTNDSSCFMGEPISWYVYGSNGTFSLEYTYSLYDDDMTVVEVGPTAAGNFSYNVNNPGTYNVRVYINDTGNSSWIYAYGPPITVSLRPAPKITKIEALSGTSLKISWTAVQGAAGYIVKRTAAGGDTPVVFYPTSTSLTNTALTPGTRYTYIVCAYCLVSGQRRISSETSAASTSVPLAKPAITSAVGVSTSQIKLNWTKVPGATGYQVFMCAASGGVYKSIKLTTALTFTAGGMLHAKTYYFKVRAYNASMR